MRWLLSTLVLSGLLLSAARAQVVRVNPRPHGVIVGSIGVSATPANVNLTLVPGSISAAQTVAVTSYWFLQAVSQASLYAFFSSTDALTNGIDVIPSSAVIGQMPSGSVPTATSFTQSGPFATGSGLKLFTRTVVVGLNTTSTDTLYLQVNLSSLPQLGAGTYSGTMSLQVQAF